MLVTGKRYNYDEVDSAPAGSIGLVYHKGQRDPGFDFIMKENGHIVSKGYPLEDRWTPRGYFLREYTIEFVYIPEQPFVPALGPINPEDITKLPVRTIMTWEHGVVYRHPYGWYWMNANHGWSMYATNKDSWDDRQNYNVIYLP